MRNSLGSLGLQSRLSLGSMLGIVNPADVQGAKKSMFGDGTYSMNIIQGGQALQVQASYQLQFALTAAMMGNVGFGTFNASQLVDGIMTGQTGNYIGTGVAGSKAYIIDLGTSNALTQLTFYGNCDGSWKIQYSDDGSTYFDAGSNVANLVDAGTAFTWTSTGSHRWWKATNTASIGACNYPLEVKAYTTINNVIVVTGAATVYPDLITGAAVFMAPNLVIDGGSLTASTNCKGLIGFVQGKVVVLNGGSINMNSKGKAGNFGDLTPYMLAPTSLQKRLHRGRLGRYVVKGEGAFGAAAISVGASTVAAGGTGFTGGVLQSGGGGSGGGYGSSTVTTGAGGKGGPCCGGGGGSAAHSASAIVGNDAAPYGPGANSPATATGACGGGAGDPNGTGYNGGGTGLGPGGGLLMLFAPSISIASGCSVTSNGSTVNTGAGDYSAPGGSSGGGIVALVAKPDGVTNSGTLAANGGAACPATPNSRGIGGAGGYGSTTLFKDAV